MFLIFGDLATPNVFTYKFFLFKLIFFYFVLLSLILCDEISFR